MTEPLEALLEGKYEILDKIAEGGIGSIYKVRHKLLEEIRVIKVLRSQVADREDLQKRLLQEAKTAIRLEHPAIARLFDLTVAEDGTAYIVMEFIDGVSLDSLLAANGPPSVELTLEVAKQSLGALSYLHDSGFIHRDISPDNLMLTRDFSDRVHVKLIDLGIAKDLAETGVTAVGTFLGKVKYCAPELFKDAGVKQLDQRSDNYSLAVTLYELLTGKHPFRGETFEELAAGHLFHPPLPFDDSDPEGRVPAELRETVLRALAKDPDERPATASEFAQALERFQVDEEQLAVEFERTVGATTRFLSKFERYSTGSTQDHLNEQFGLSKTAVAAKQGAGDHQSPAESPADSPAAGPSPSEPPEAEPRAEETRSVGPTEMRTAVSEVREPESGTPGKGRNPRWLAALAGVPLLALAGWWFLRPTTPDAQSETTAAPAAAFAPAERFAGGSTDTIIDVPAVPDELVDEVSGEAAASDASEEAVAAATGNTTTAGNPPSQASPKPAQPRVEQPSEREPVKVDLDRPIELLKPGAGVTPPKLLDRLDPPYPRPDKKPIVIVVSAFVTQDGKVSTARVRNSRSFRRRYREAAVAAVQRARFEAATKDGVPGKMWVDVEVVFKP